MLRDAYVELHIWAAYFGATTLSITTPSIMKFSMANTEHNGTQYNNKKKQHSPQEQSEN
jgi:hypothetical protein